MGIFDPTYGKGRRSGYVAKLKRMVYGQWEAGLAWIQLLDKFFRNLQARPTVTHKMIYTWSFNGFKARFAVYVDNILCSVADPSVHEKFPGFFGFNLVLAMSPR